MLQQITPDELRERQDLVCKLIATLPRPQYPEQPYICKCILQPDGYTAQLFYYYNTWPHRTLKDITYKSFDDLVLQLYELQSAPPLMYPIRPVPPPPEAPKGDQIGPPC